MIVSFKIFESKSNSYPTTVYHGTTKAHEFDRTGEEANGTFFSSEDFFAEEYCGEWKGVEDGKLYEVILKPNLNIFNTENIKNCKILIDKFGAFEDDVEKLQYCDDNNSYIIDTPRKLFNLIADEGDNWFAIEKQPGCLEWLEQNYDGVIIFENEVQNILIFNPVKEKIISFKEI